MDSVMCGIVTALRWVVFVCFVRKIPQDGQIERKCGAIETLVGAALGKQLRQGWWKAC